MYFDRIFDSVLYAVRYKNNEDNEYDRLMELWDDAEHLFNYLTTNKHYLPKNETLRQLLNQIIDDHETLDDLLIKTCEGAETSLSQFFQPLHNSEYRLTELSLQKKRLNYLRLYAVKIDSNTFIVTGGAIKLVQRMQEHPDTELELQKLNQVRQFLRENQITDNLSLTEYIKEQSDE